ncbi:MFS transporter [Actinomycetospora soli]|uniref:MFS transporter n=1 Tax=Actinomycetospora soli TaxID=2893887 RepID=UPI001E35BA1F|nr:MFS transporter [Actinomycetospora soli]MCD2191541.1 MFS transporter [Actinomycetospora soli]
MLWVGQAVNTTGLMMLVPVMPFYVEQLGVQGTAAASTWAGVAIAAPALALTAVTPLWGRVGDRIGRKWMVVRALLGLALAMVVMAFASSPLLLVVGRLLQGTLGGVVEAAAAFVGAVGPRKGRGEALGKSFSATATGSLLGPLVGGALVGSSALPQFMLVVAGCAAVAAAGCAVGLREPTPQEDQPTPADSHRGQARASRVRWRSLPSSAAVAGAAACAYFAIYGLIPVFAARIQELEPARAGEWVGALHATMWGASLAASTWWGRRNDRLDRPMATFALAATGCAIAIACQAVITEAWLLVGPRLLLGVCFAAIAQSLFLHVGHHAHEARRSAMVGTANSFLLLGQSLGPLLAGPALALTPPSAAIVALGLVGAVGALLAARVARTRPATSL